MFILQTFFQGNYPKVKFTEMAVLNNDKIPLQLEIYHFKCDKKNHLFVGYVLRKVKLLFICNM